MALVRENASYRSVPRKAVWMSCGDPYKSDVWSAGDSHAPCLLREWDTSFFQKVGKLGVHEMFTFSGSGKTFQKVVDEIGFNLGLSQLIVNGRFLTGSVVIIAEANDLLKPKHSAHSEANVLKDGYFNELLPRDYSQS